jgi:hypothetical protein
MTVAAALLVALVTAVNNSNGGAPENPAAAAQANRESQILVAEDQAPHAARVSGRARGQQALEHAIAADASGRIRRQEMTGPLQSVRCDRNGATRAVRQGFRCTVVAGNVGYPFLGVIDLRAATVTWCKRDPPPNPAFDVAVSHRCRA